jgi:hypothetical protein
MDYRKLNDVTRKDCFAVPRIDNTLDTLAEATWVSTLDLKSSYWQVDLHPDNKEKTAFSMGQGLWQFTVIPFGLCNTPVAFEQLMETVLRGLMHVSCIMYLDVIVIGRTFQEHLLNKRKVPRSLPKVQSREVPTFSEGSVVPRACCVTCGDYRP